jgi:hypothetical protein
VLSAPTRYTAVAAGIAAFYVFGKSLGGGVVVGTLALLGLHALGI